MRRSKDSVMSCSSSNEEAGESINPFYFRPTMSVLDWIKVWSSYSELHVHLTVFLLKAIAKLSSLFACRLCKLFIFCVRVYRSL